MAGAPPGKLTKRQGFLPERRSAVKKFQNARTVLCLVLAVLIFGGMAGYAFYRNSENTQGKAPENILKTAERTLAENREEISALIKENGDADLAPSELSLGKHFNISYPVAVSKAKRSKSENFNDYLKDSGEWLFLVMDQDKPVSTLAVDEKGLIYYGKDPSGFRGALKGITAASGGEKVRLADIDYHYYFVGANGDAAAVAPDRGSLQTEAGRKAYSTVMKSAKLCRIYRENLTDQSSLPVDQLKVGDLDLLQLYLSEG
jgi:hypothetical protein